MTRGQRTRMPRAERAAQILALAEQLFTERGYALATMDELAERAGVSKPVIYDHFASKERLLLTLLARARAELLDATARSMAGHTEPRAALRAALLAFFRFIDDHRASWSALNRESALLSGEAGREVEALRAQQADVIADFLHGSGLSADPAAAAAHAQIVIGAGERLALWQESHPELTAEAAADRMLAVLWHGLGTAAGSGA
ncbi:TetR/AcrR family transcriptional regulator [Streptomyces millisiae]|uniref:Helix-turn-helix domain-containing protein n=1 Tax=Streptomyces millisiae TaxID=3075542 RepID=A0ABU2LV46_9ACTN|nr:helix-turn-helix domain-containing protein [Streptomyces sp. DSM 44918]MDT0321138.1 helix-turn-helix domain-containing protein [Streptomyces sp. DSM 44918]